MATKFYKLYTSFEYDYEIDLELYETNHRWSLDQTRIMLEFKEGHDNTEGVLTHQQAVDYMNNHQWALPDPFQPTFE